jgi:outer membrane protein
MYRARMKRIVAALLLVFCLADVQAQNRVLTFEEAIQIALRNNIALNQQRNNLELSQAQKQAAWASLAPNVNINSSVSRRDGNSFNQNEGRVINGVFDAFSMSVNANMVLFNGLNNFYTIRQANAGLDAQAYFVKRTTQDAINTVAIQYLNVLLDIELLKIARENHEAQAKLLEQIKEQHRLGARSPVDEYNQDALTKGAELRAVVAEVTLDNDKALLAQTLLLDALEPFDVVKPNWDATEIGSENYSVDTLVTVAKQQRADYLRALKTVEATRFGMAASRSNMLPSLVAFGGFGSAYNYPHVSDSVVIGGVLVPNPNFPRPFDTQFRSDNVFKQYGLQLQIPIFNGLRNRATTIQQKVVYKNNELLMQGLELQIRNDVLRSVKTYEGTRKAFLVSGDQLKAAQSAFMLETERYNLGVTNFVDYTNANRALIQAQTDAAQAENRLIFQKIVIAYAVGTLVPEDIIGQ